MKIHTIGGFNEVGKNMTVIELQDDAIILDSGFYLPAIVELQEQERNQKAYSEKKLRDITSNLIHKRKIIREELKE